MKIRNRIWLYNTLMVLLSLIVLLFVGSSVISVWGFWDREEPTEPPRQTEQPAPAEPVIEEPEKTSPKTLLIWFLIIGAVTIVIIMPITSFFTGQLLRYITKPLSELVAAAGRVELGDLATEIDYQGSDEFKTFCDAFDRMQAHLNSERVKNAAYEKARTDLITGISHDLRTPLTSVRGYIKGIADGIANTEEKRQRYLNTAYAKAGEMDVLLEKLFFFSKLETGSLPMNLRPLDLADFVRSFVGDASLDPRLQQVDIQADCTAGSHLVLADAEQLRRVLNNLTENAIKYANAEPLQLRIRVCRLENDEYLTFQDNGQGVEPALLSEMFEQFWRGDSARAGGNSSGLGLYIVRHIIDNHGGSITADSPGGLRLTIRLPALAADHPIQKEETL